MPTSSFAKTLDREKEGIGISETEGVRSSLPPKVDGLFSINVSNFKGESGKRSSEQVFLGKDSRLPVRNLLSVPMRNFSTISIEVQNLET